MEIQSILSSLYLDKRLTTTISKFTKPCDVEDVRQEVFLKLLLQDCELIKSLHDKGVLFYYSIVIARNQAIDLYRKNKHTVVDDFSEIESAESDICDRIARERNEDLLIKSLSTIPGDYPYHKELINIIVKEGSMNKVAVATGIPLTSIHRDVTFVRSFLKSMADAPAGRIC